jgi:arabinogalactan endo-1,4-beta-galactosidase
MKPIACCYSYLFVITALVLAGLSGAAGAPSPAAPAQRKLPAFLTGGDISLLTREEQLGQVYKDHGKARGLLAIFKSDGCNCMRLRLWAHPQGTDIYVNDLPYTIALGRRIKKAGFYLLLDIHYSDSWADAGKQPKPAAWKDLPFDQLVKTVHDYTSQVIAAMARGGAMPDMVQVGNEITGGMLWPDGKDWGPGHDFKNLGVLLKSAIQGVKDGAGSAPAPLIMIHIDRGGDWAGTKWFFDNIDAQGVTYDVIGESYYPFFHGPLSQLKTTLDNAAALYHKPIIVVETGYAYRPDGRADNKAVTYPKTPEGQSQFLQALIATVKSTPDNLGRGVIYWAPEWIPVSGLKGSWNATTLFDDAGNALPGIDVLGRAADPHIAPKN